MFLETKQCCWYLAMFLSQPFARDCTSLSRKVLELVLVTVFTVCFQQCLPWSCLGQHLAPSLLVFLCSKTLLLIPIGFEVNSSCFGFICSVTELRFPLCELCWASQCRSKCKAQGFHAISHYVSFTGVIQRCTAVKYHYTSSSLPRNLPVNITNTIRQDEWHALRK